MQWFEFTGISFSTCNFTSVQHFPLSDTRHNWSWNFWRHHPNVSTGDLHWLFGILTYMATLVPRGRTRLHPFQWWASDAWLQGMGQRSHHVVFALPIHINGLVGLNCSTAGSLTKNSRDWGYAIHWCFHKYSLNVSFKWYICINRHLAIWLLLLFWATHIHPFGISNRNIIVIWILWSIYSFWFLEESIIVYNLIPI